MQPINEILSQWCQSKNLSMLNGQVNGTKSTNIFNCSNDDLFDFLEVGFQNDIKHIIYDYDVFEIDSELEDYIDSDDPEITKEKLIDNYFKEYTQYEDHVCKANIFWTKEGVTYLYQFAEDWYIKFIEEMESISEKGDELMGELRAPQLPADVQKKLVEKLASSDDFFANHTRPNNFNYVLNKVVEEEKINIDNYSISELHLKLACEDLFNRKYKNRKENEFGEKIRELKSENITKKEIISRLGITEGLYDKCLYA